MAQTSWPFENIDTTETQFSQWARNINEGIKQGNGGELEVTAAGTGMTVDVAAGQMLIRGHYYSSTASESLAITAADATNPRIDSVVVELDPTANTVLLKVLAGTPAGSPVAPTLTQTDAGIYQIRLANIQVDAATLAIESGDVTDLRTYMFAGIGKWTTATRPENPVQYQTTGYNTTINAHEFWNGTAWENINDNTNAILKSTVTTAGDLIVADGDSSVTRLGIGTSGQVLSSDGTTAIWETLDTADSIITTEGDLIVGDVSGDAARLAIGLDTQVLTSNGTTAVWQDPAAGGGWELLSTTSWNSGLAFQLNSIPQTYKNLRVVLSNNTTSLNAWLRITIRNGTTPINITTSALRPDLVWVRENTNSFYQGGASGFSHEGGTITNFVFDLYEYTASDKNKTFNLFGSMTYSGTRQGSLVSGGTTENTIVDSIMLERSHLVTGGIVQLYGGN